MSFWKWLMRLFYKKPKPAKRIQHGNKADKSFGKETEKMMNTGDAKEATKAVRKDGRTTLE